MCDNYTDDEAKRLRCLRNVVITESLSILKKIIYTLSIDSGHPLVIAYNKVSSDINTYNRPVLELSDTELSTLNLVLIAHDLVPHNRGGVIRAYNLFLSDTHKLVV